MEGVGKEGLTFEQRRPPMGTASRVCQQRHSEQTCWVNSYAERREKGRGGEKEGRGREGWKGGRRRKEGGGRGEEGRIREGGVGGREGGRSGGTERGRRVIEKSG